MLNGEILFIIAPSHNAFKDITHQSIVRHEDIQVLKTYGFYIMDKNNEKDWKIYDNKYLNILNVCYRFKDNYDTAIVLSGNIFLNLKSFQQFKDFLNSILISHFLEKNDFIVGFPYLNKEQKVNFLKNYLIDNIDNEYHKILNLYKNTDKIFIDLDFCFINLTVINNYIKPFEFFKKLKFIKNPQLYLNLVLLDYIQIAKTPNIYFKQNIYGAELSSLCGTNPFIYKFTDNFFPLKKLIDSKLNQGTTLINYYIFNRLYDEYLKIDKTKLDDDLCFYIEDNYIKTYFTENIIKGAK